MIPKDYVDPDRLFKTVLNDTSGENKENEFTSWFSHSLFDNVQRAPLDRIRNLYYTYSPIVRITVKYSSTNPRRALAMRTYHVAFKMRELERLEQLSTIDKCKIMRKACELQARRHRMWVDIVRKNMYTTAKLRFLRAISMYKLVYALYELDLKYRDFSRYMLQNTVLEAAGQNSEPEKTKAYAIYAYFRAAYQYVYSELLAENGTGFPTYDTYSKMVSLRELIKDCYRIYGVTVPVGEHMANLAMNLTHYVTEKELWDNNTLLLESGG